MKKVLVTGAAGTIGSSVIKYLLSEGKYEITAVDLKNAKVYKKLKRYRKRVNVVYGDVIDRTLIENLVKEHDIVMHFATCMPPLAEYKKQLVNIIEYNSLENIVKAINYYNPKCHLIYASTTSLYGPKDSKSVKSEVNIGDFDFYADAKYKCEKLISKKLKEYTIVRVPLVLGNLNEDSFIYNVLGKSQIEVITKEDAAYAFVKVIDEKSTLNKKIINIGGGATCRCSFNYLMTNILKYHGLTFNYIFNYLFVAKNYYSPYLSDSDASNELLGYKNDSLQSYFMRQKRRSKKRKVALLMGKILNSVRKKLDK